MPVYLDRREKEMVVFSEGTPNEIRLLVVRVHGKRVSLGIVAPPGVVVRREEVATEEAEKWVRPEAPGAGDPRKEAAGG